MTTRFLVATLGRLQLSVGGTRYRCRSVLGRGSFSEASRALVLAPVSHLVAWAGLVRGGCGKPGKPRDAVGCSSQS